MELPDPSALADVAVFPLPDVVLFPRTVLPLRIFEPRYRAMFSDCLARPDPLMAVAQLRPGFEGDYHGRPPVYDVAGLGRVIAHEAHANGTYDLILRGVARVRLTELPAEDTPYRRAELLAMRTRVAVDGLPSNTMTALLSLAGRLAHMLKSVQPDFELAMPVDADQTTQIDYIADQLLIEPGARQEALELLDLAARQRFVMARLAELHEALQRSNGDQILH